jgi:hypothetical protein
MIKPWSMMDWTMDFYSTYWMVIWGGGLVLFAALIMWRTSSYDLSGAAFDSAWQLARGKRTAENPTAIEQKLRDINAEASVTGKAKRAAGTVLGHLVAKVLNTAAMLMIAVGAALIVAGIFWR